MVFNTKNYFTCPVCKEPLEDKGRSKVCKNNHTFDLSKSNYVNLLLSNNKNSKIPGDNKLMVNARRDFLEKDYYKPLSDELGKQVVKYSLEGGLHPITVLDAGCGEGYYTGNVYNDMKKAEIPVSMLGVDISKFALNVAGKKQKEISYAVASIFHLPMEDKSVDIMLNLFAPFDQVEFSRVLKRGGYLFMIIPGENHLWELKSAIYDNPYKNEVKDYEVEGFEFIESVKVKSEIKMPCNEDIQNLFTMTPYYYKTSIDNTKRLEQLNELTTKIEFEIVVLKKA